MLRISLQKSVDLAARLPINVDFALESETAGKEENISGLHNASLSIIDSLSCSLQDSSTMLRSEVERTCDQPQKKEQSDESRQNSKRKRGMDVTMGDSLSAAWDDINHSQEQLESNWKNVLNKWHSRLNFGSERAKASLQVFNTSLWEQVEDILLDSNRCIEKSRVPVAESTRIGLGENRTGKLTWGSEDTKGDISTAVGRTAISEFEYTGRQQGVGPSSNKYDEEVYDDRPFYAMLLKTFITSSAKFEGSGVGINSSGADARQQQQQDLTLTMRAADLEALRRYKRKKLNVERKASKGRKIRYTVHDKLQNFMFPVESVVATVGTQGATGETARIFNTDRRSIDTMNSGGGMTDVHLVSRGGGHTFDTDKLFQSLFQ